MSDTEMENEKPYNFCYDEEIQSINYEESSVTQNNEEKEQLEEVQETQEKETESSVYKPHHLDTETLIKGEIKQLILTDVSKAINAKILNDTVCELEEQIHILKLKNNHLLSKNEDLDKEVETDESRLEQSKNILLHTNEMIGLLKENIECLEKRIKESRIRDILLKSKQQFAKFEALKATYTAKIEEKCASINQEVNKEKEIVKSMALEKKDKQEKTNILKQKYNEAKQRIAAKDEEIAKYLNKKQLLEDKLAKIKNRRANQTLSKNETIHNDLLQKLNAKKEKQLEKLSKLNQEKIAKQQQLADCDQEIDSIASSTSAVKAEIAEKEVLLSDTKEQFESIKKQYAISVEKLEQEYKDNMDKMSEIQTKIFSLSKINSEKSEILNALNTDYVTKQEEKLTLTKELLEQRTVLRDLEQIYQNKQSENASYRNNLEELQKHKDNLISSSKLSKEEILNEQNELSEALSKLLKEFDLIKSENEKYFDEMRKKKEYALATSNYLKEKYEKLQQEVELSEKNCKNLEEENAALKDTVNKKQSSLDEMKRKLHSLKKGEIGSKPGLKSPVGESVVKKVKFNEVLSFKSTTESSENSSLPLVEARSQLERSFSDWLEAKENEK